ncbi:MAG: 6-hydroxy-D-nicotine oxidase [Steroidobacteraceae bacterium]|nr:6-hydroxy-D-nicotine oxidase [Steroidobacteraceae bacterium]
MFPIEQARGVLDAFADFCHTASDELWMDPVLECDAAGHRKVSFVLCHCGKPAEAEKEIAKIRKFGTVLRDNVAAKPWVVVQSEYDADSPHGRGYYMAGGRVTELPAALLDHAIASIRLPGAELAKISLTQHGGAVTRRSDDSTAYASRAARTAWHKEVWKEFQPFSVGLYANLNATEANVRARAAYGENLERLVEIKTKYDPKNLFHLNPNIVPRAAG